MATVERELMCDGANGVYIPQMMAERLVEHGWKNIDKKDVETCLAGPEHEWYWEAWNSITDNATFEDNGKTWNLEQDGDLWAVRYGTKFSITDIQYDTEGEEVDLPEELFITVANEDLESAEDLASDFISDETGYCHNGFEMDEVYDNEF